MKKQIKVLFDENGNQLIKSDKRRIYQRNPITEVDNYEFDETLFYDRYEGAESTSIIVWKDRKEKEYRSSMKMLDKILSGKDRLDNKRFLSGLQIQGKFTFVKRGTSIFLTFAE